MSPLLEQFLIEARENLSFLDENLEKLKDGDDDTINALFRAAHTLKGSSGLAGFEDIKSITHVAEDILDSIRNKELSASQEIIDSLYDAFDYIVELVDQAEEVGDIPNSSKEDIEKIVSNLRSFGSKEEEVVLEFGFEIEAVAFGEYVDDECVEQMASEVRFVEDIDQSLLQKGGYFYVYMDLDENTLLSGNDPLYLLSLANCCDIKTIIRCDEDIEELKLRSLFIGIGRYNQEEIEDYFYNVLDEITIYPVSIESLLLSSKEHCDEELLKEFRQNFYKSDLLQNIRVLLDIVPKESFEHLFLRRFLLLYDKVDQKRLTSFLQEQFDIPQKEKSQKEDSIQKSILKQQLEVLEYAKDAAAFERVKRTIENVLGKEVAATSKEELEHTLREILGEEAPKKEQKATPPSKSEPKAKPHKEQHHIPKVVKVEQEQIDRIMDLSGELLVLKNSLPYIAQKLEHSNILQVKREILSKYEEISRVVEQLQENIMDMRLMPISYIFDRYPKLVRELSKKLGKKIELVLEGKETKLDKMVIEKIADPLIHVIRNSLDHGIETPDVRKAKGKDETGHLIISAKSQGDKVFIVVEDDGAGVDVDKVAIKALEKGVITEAELETLTYQEKLELIFHPGLSTKDEVTELSGRGVGSDAIKRVTEELGGKITIESQKDKGTKITIEIPISVALSNVFHFMINNTNYAVAMEGIVETVKVKKEEIKSANQLPFISLRGELIPLVFDKRLLCRDKFHDLESLLIIQGRKKRYGVVVDQFMGELSVVAKPANKILKEHPFISGISLLGNGDILFILDIYKLIKE